MHNFQYVSRKQLSPVKQDLIQIINSVQNQVRKDFTFRYDFVGSVKRNMVTYDIGTNVGFDFDVNIQVNDKECRFSAKEIKTKIRIALNKIVHRYGYDNAEDSTRVLTIKVKDKKSSRIIHSCDFAIVNNYTDNNGNDRQQYIRFNKNQNAYTWEDQPDEYYLLDEKAEWIRNNGYTSEMRKLYLRKKNFNTDLNKHSRSIFAETVHEICQKYGCHN